MRGALGLLEPQPLAVFLSGAATAWAFVGIAAFAVVFLYPQLTFLDGVPDLGDPLLSIWRMGWVNHWMTAAIRGRSSAQHLLSGAAHLTYSDSMLLPAVIGAPLLALGLHPVVAYNLLFMSGFGLSAWRCTCSART